MERLVFNSFTNNQGDCFKIYQINALDYIKMSFIKPINGIERDEHIALSLIELLVTINDKKLDVKQLIILDVNDVKMVLENINAMLTPITDLYDKT